MIEREQPKSRRRTLVWAGAGALLLVSTVCSGQGGPAAPSGAASPTTPASAAPTGPATPAPASQVAGWTGAIFQDGSGAIPPPFAWEATLELRLRPATKQLACAYQRRWLHREGMSAQEIRDQGAQPDDDLRQPELLLDGIWYEDAARLLREARSCPVTAHRGSERRFFLLGPDGNRQEVGLQERDVARPGGSYLCPPSGEQWETLLGQIVRAMEQEAGRTGLRQLVFLQRGPTGVQSRLELRLDHRQRQLRVTRTIPPGAPPKNLGPGELEQLITLLAGPNYHAAEAGEPTVAGEYLDRGDGFRSFTGGLKDPAGRTGAVEALRGYLQALAH